MATGPDAADFQRCTWEQAVLFLRADPAMNAFVKACYLDDPLPEAAARFARSEEWEHVRRLLAGRRGLALDVGAGRGIASYALAKDGWRVCAVEPDLSAVVGAGAIRRLSRETGVAVEVLATGAESLPFLDCSVDLVYGRQVLHHLASLPRACAEMRRVLKPGGILLATREHVIRRECDRERFLENHMTHRWTGSENAWRLPAYLDAMRQAGLRVVTVLRPLESPINYAPMTEAEWRVECLRPLVRAIGWRRTLALADGRSKLGRRLVAIGALMMIRGTYEPGALFTILAERSE